VIHYIVNHAFYSVLLFEIRSPQIHDLMIGMGPLPPPELQRSCMMSFNKFCHSVLFSYNLFSNSWTVYSDILIRTVSSHYFSCIHWSWFINGPKVSTAHDTTDNMHSKRHPLLDSGI